MMQESLLMMTQENILKISLRSHFGFGKNGVVDDQITLLDIGQQPLIAFAAIIPITKILGQFATSMIRQQSHSV